VPPGGAGLPRGRGTGSSSAGGFSGTFGGAATGGASSANGAGFNPGRLGGGPGGGGALGGLLNSGTPSKALVTALQADAGSYRWVAAVVGANSAAGVQLATDDAVLAIGGFNGTDPTPTLAQFESLVHKGEIHYYLSSGSGGGGVGGSASSSAIASWVEAHYSAKTIGGVTVYDLAAGAR
jgi:hypothetical protein